MPKSPDPISITNDVLRSFFGFHTPLQSHDRGKTWILNNEYSCGETDDVKGNHYTLFLFPIKEDLSKIAENTPFYFSLSMTIKENDQIEKINLKIFKDDHTKVKITSSIPTELILRVDWDNTVVEDNKICKHAQPHWHIHSYKHVDLFENRGNSVRQTILDLLGQDPKPTQLSSLMQQMEDRPTIIPKKAMPATFTDGKIPLFRFHLAMLAEWDKTNDSLCNKTLNNENLKVWLPQCLNYIKDQLEYILEKIGNLEPLEVQPSDSML